MRDKFEEAKRLDDQNNEFWSARDLSRILNYSEYRNFLPLIEKAKTVCNNEGKCKENHFVEVHEMVTIGSSAHRRVKSYALTSYACYVLMELVDSKKPLATVGKIYFKNIINREFLMNSSKNSLQTAYIKNAIYDIRGYKIIMDKDIAALYEVKPARLREQVKRNSNRFPKDFMFQLNVSEVDFMVSQNAIPSRKHLGGTMPYVFTEQGVASLSGIIRSKKAAEVHIKIMRAFVEMRKFIAYNATLFQRLDKVEQKQIATDIKQIETEEKIDTILDALESRDRKPPQGIFYDGQVFDAYLFISDLVKSAGKSILLIDNFIDESVLQLFTKRKKAVSVTIYTKKISRILRQDLEKHNSQYPKIEILEFTKAHDRFLIIDETDIYHFGASLKDLGKKWFAFSKMDMKAIEMIAMLSEKNNGSEYSTVSILETVQLEDSNQENQDYE